MTTGGIAEQPKQVPQVSDVTAVLPSTVGDRVRSVLKSEDEEARDGMIEDATGGRDAPQAEHIHLLFDPVEVLSGVVGHRRRFANAVATFTDDELVVPSRCEGWSVADVLRHGIWVDEVIQGIWSGGKSLENFDPRTTPNEFVETHRDVPDAEIQRRYLSSTDAMVVELESTGADRFGVPSVSPMGNVPWWFTVVHLMWDSTIHERDALVPLGRGLNLVPGETMPVLGYSLVLASFFAGPDPLTAQVDAVRLQHGGGPVTTWANTADDQADGAGVALSMSRSWSCPGTPPRPLMPSLAEATSQTYLTARQLSSID